MNGAAHRLPPIPDTLPDPLLGADGRLVDDAAAWTSWRRAELLDLFRTHVYGREPSPAAVTMSASVTSQVEYPAGSMRRRVVHLSLHGPRETLDIPILMLLPLDDSRAHPAMLLLNNRGPGVIGTGQRFRSFWPADDLVARGYVAVMVDLNDLCPDADHGFTRGVHPVIQPSKAKTPRPPDAWATIAAWAWGASRVLDHLQNDVDIDAQRIALVGHSRGGKAALWAGALDERFAMVVSNDSGCTGAALSRGKTGERVADINRVFPHWFAKTYRRFNNREDRLPVDQHELLALIAPRLLYVASAADDVWADPGAELRALLCAEPVYRLFGPNRLFETWEAQKKGLARLGQQFHDRTIGHHRRAGEHDLTRYDWYCFLDFADGRL